MENLTNNYLQAEIIKYIFFSIIFIVFIFFAYKSRSITSKLAKLIDVKSIVTLIIICMFAYLAINGKIQESTINNIVFTVIAFYFGTQFGKKSKDIIDDEKE